MLWRWWWSLRRRWDGSATIPCPLSPAAVTSWVAEGACCAPHGARLTEWHHVWHRSQRGGQRHTACWQRKRHGPETLADETPVAIRRHGPRLLLQRSAAGAWVIPQVREKRHTMCDRRTGARLTEWHLCLHPRQGQPWRRGWTVCSTVKIHGACRGSNPDIRKTSCSLLFVEDSRSSPQLTEAVLSTSRVL